MTPASAHILLVDDDPSAVQLMSRLLGHYPQQRFARSGTDALRLVRESRPDLIVLDAELPDLSGLDVCETLATDRSLVEVPIIFASSHRDACIELAALGSGASDFVHKPLQASSLAARAQAQLRQRQRDITRRLDHRAALCAARRPDKLVPRLLLVDDDVTALNAMRRVLDGLAELHFATTASTAQRLSDDLQPELVLLDIEMPGMDGFGLFDRLQGTACPGASPDVVFVTRRCEPAIERRALEQGALDVIFKSRAPELLRGRVQRQIRDRQRCNDTLRAVGRQWLRLGDERRADSIGASPDAVLCVDAQGCVVLANAAAGRLFDNTRGGPIGRQRGQSPGTALDAVLQVAGLSPGAAAALPRTLPVVHADGSVTLVEPSLSRQASGDAPLTTVVLRDHGSGPPTARHPRPDADTWRPCT